MSGIGGVNRESYIRSRKRHVVSTVYFCCDFTIDGGGVRIRSRVGYKEEYRKINEFLIANQDKKILFLELGVGRMTPMFIQEPFWNLTYSLPRAFYITINPKDAILPQALVGKGIAIKEDIASVLRDAVALSKKDTGHEAGH